MGKREKEELYMRPFLTISSEELESFEKIILSGTRGTHLLFSNRMIREAFHRRPKPLDLLSDQDLAFMVQEALGDLLEIVDFDERQEFIESLPVEVRDLLVHLYFGFLDRYFTEDKTPEVLH